MKITVFLLITAFFLNGASLVAQLIKNPPAMQETWVRSLGGEDSPGEENDYPLQYSCLENPMDKGAWWATVGCPRAIEQEELEGRGTLSLAGSAQIRKVLH